MADFGLMSYLTYVQTYFWASWNCSHSLQCFWRNFLTQNLNKIRIFFHKTLCFLWKNNSVFFYSCRRACGLFCNLPQPSQYEIELTLNRSLLTQKQTLYIWKYKITVTFENKQKITLAPIFPRGGQMGAKLFDPPNFPLHVTEKEN